MRTSFLKALVASFIFQLFIFSAYSQTVTTDRVDYMPGNTIMASGKDWGPGEAVQLILAEQVLNPKCPVIAEKTVNADASGKFSTDLYRTLTMDIGAFFHITAKGSKSNHTATITCNNSRKEFVNSILPEVALVVYPNPFATTTRFELKAKMETHIRLEIFNQAGTLLKILYDEDLKEGDSQSIEFNAASYPHTVFTYRVTTDSRAYSGTVMKTS